MLHLPQAPKMTQLTTTRRVIEDEQLNREYLAELELETESGDPDEPWTPSDEESALLVDVQVLEVRNLDDEGHVGSVDTGEDAQAAKDHVCELIEIDALLEQPQGQTQTSAATAESSTQLREVVHQARQSQLDQRLRTG